MRYFTSVLLLWSFLGSTNCESFNGRVLYKGCYTPVTLGRNLGPLLIPFSSDRCFALCARDGHRHAGLASINFACYCGDDILSKIVKSQDSQCKPCKDFADHFCGGILKISLYEIIYGNTTTVNETQGHHEIENLFDEGPLILVAGQGGIYSCNGTDNLKTIIEVNFEVEALDYDVRKKRAFAIWDRELFSFPLLGEQILKQDQAESITHVGRCPTFAVDWVHGMVYYPDCYGHHIAAMDLNDINKTEITIRNIPDGAWAMDMAVDPYKGLLFWTTGATLWSCRLDGRGLTKVIPEFAVNRVASISLDLAAERIYFAGLDKHDKNTSRLYYTSYNGSISHSLQYEEYEGGSHILSFGIFNQHVYFLKHLDNNDSIVMSTKLDYNHRPTIFVDGKSYQLNRLRLVHPRLQSPGKVDACTDSGCSHMCLVESSLPHCYCPRYHELDHLNKTCVLIGVEESVMDRVMQIVYGLVLVLIVVLGAGVLLCLCDKLWSQLHPTVVRLSVPGATKMSFTGLRRQDAENLI